MTTPTPTKLTDDASLDTTIDAILYHMGKCKGDFADTKHRGACRSILRHHIEASAAPAPSAQPRCVQRGSETMTTPPPDIAQTIAEIDALHICYLEDELAAATKRAEEAEADARTLAAMARGGDDEFSPCVALTLAALAARGIDVDAAINGAQP